MIDGCFYLRLDIVLDLSSLTMGPKAGRRGAGPLVRLEAMDGMVSFSISLAVRKSSRGRDSVSFAVWFLSFVLDRTFLNTQSGQCFLMSLQYLHCELMPPARRMIPPPSLIHLHLNRLSDANMHCSLPQERRPLRAQCSDRDGRPVSECLPGLNETFSLICDRRRVSGALYLKMEVTSLPAQRDC